MSALPPHLPKKEKIVVSTHTTRSLFYFVSCMLIAIVASLATVFVAFSYVLPRAVPEVQFYSFEHKTTPTEPQLDNELLGFIDEREALLFDKRQQLSTRWYPAGSSLSSGVFLTSDGWTVFPLSLTEPIDKKNLEVVDSRGGVYALENIFVDKNLGLVYAKIKGEGFRFVSFGNWNVLQKNTRVIGQKDNEYILTAIAGIQKNPEIKLPLEIWKQPYLYTLKENLSGIVFTDQGELLGLSRDNGLFPGWYIELGFRSLLSDQKLSYSAFAWKGQLVDHELQNGFVRDTLGFFVTEGDTTKDGIKPGDVIVKIQDQSFSLTTLSHVLLQAPQTVSVELIRNGETMVKTIPKQIINF